MLLIYKKRAAKQTKRLALRKCTYFFYFSSYSSEIWHVYQEQVPCATSKNPYTCGKY